MSASGGRSGAGVCWGGGLFAPNLRSLIRVRQQLVDYLLPGGEGVVDLVAVEAVECVAAEVEPGAVGVVMVDHLLPYLYRKAERGLFLPRDLLHLEAFFFGAVEDGATEEEGEGDLAVLKRVEVLDGGQVEIVGAG